MIHMLIVDGQADELWLIQREAHEQAALLTDERWDVAPGGAGNQRK